MTRQTKPISKHGGAREGAGRKRRTPEQLLALGEQERKAKKAAPILSVALDLFIAAVAHERETFSDRLIPGSTVLKNLDGTEFTWTADHPLTIMKEYADSIIQLKIPAGSLAILAATRFLKDIESGAGRGLFLDPVAVQNIAKWYSSFNVPGSVLQPWEIFVLGQTFGWKVASGLRRFREVWLEVAKKNGKTFLQAGVALFLILCDQEIRAEVYSIANSKDQAKICYRAARQMLEDCEHLMGAVRIYNNAFVNGSSFYRVLSSETRSLDGPNVSGACFDEVHEFSDGGLWDKLVAGVVARSQPLVFSCTTAGDKPEGFAGLRHDYMVKLLTGVFDEDSKLVFIAALDKEDDFKDESNWIKANPNLGITVRVEALREQVQEIKGIPQQAHAIFAVSLQCLEPYANRPHASNR